jgi:hypothetical protein
MYFFLLPIALLGFLVPAEASKHSFRKRLDKEASRKRLDNKEENVIDAKYLNLASLVDPPDDRTRQEYRHLGSSSDASIDESASMSMSMKLEMSISTSTGYGACPAGLTSGPFNADGSATEYPRNECACFYPLATAEPTPAPVTTPSYPIPVYGNGFCPHGLQFKSISGDDRATTLGISWDDDETQLVSLPFDFNFFNYHLSNNMRVSTNGIINIDASDTKSSLGTSNDNVTPTIALVADDLNPGFGTSTGGIYTLVQGTSSSFIVSWEDVAFSGDGEGTVNAQVELFPDGKMFMCWGTGVIPQNRKFEARLDPGDGGLDSAFPVTGGPFSADGIVTDYPTNECACFYPLEITPAPT